MATKTFYIELFVIRASRGLVFLRIHDAAGLLSGVKIEYEDPSGGSPVDVEALTQPQVGIVYEREIHLSRQGKYLILKEGLRLLTLQGDAQVTTENLLVEHLPSFLCLK